MPDMITRCPKCATAFRISDTLLKSAKGMVRCGSCLHVFNASEHLQSKPATPALPPEGENASETAMDHAAHIGERRPHEQQGPSPASRSPITDHRAVVQAVPISITGFLKQQDGITPDARVDVPESKQPRLNIEQGGGLFERSTPSKGAKEEEELEPDDDEAWALELLKDDSDLNVQFKKITEKPATVASTDLPDSSSNASAVDFENYPEADTAPLPDNQAQAEKVEFEADLSTAHDESEHIYPDDFLEDEVSAPADPEQEVAHIDEQMPDLLAPAAPAPVEHQEVSDHEPEQAEKATVTVEATETEDEHEKLKELQSTPVRARAAKPTAAFNQSSGSIHEAIASIEPEPLEVEWEPTPNWKKRLLWPALALVALLLLLGQVAWLEYHRLNRIEPYRSMYAIACQYLNCTLPDMVDRSKIQTSNLVVRSHPEVEDALMVDVILRNNAEFEQTFPSLLLTFSNLRNEPVASRRLSPDEYLGGELAGSNLMPVRQPIHIGLEIADPGQEAVSYSIAIVD